MNEDLPLRVDFEDGAAAIADEEIAFRVESRASSDAHTFDIVGEFARGIDAIDVAFSARGDEEVAVGIEGEAGGIENSGDEWSGAAIGADADDGDWRLLAARAGDGGVDHAGAADGGTGDGVQAVVKLAGDAEAGGVGGAGGRADFNEPGGGLGGNAKGQTRGPAMSTWAGWSSTSDGGHAEAVGAQIGAYQLDFAQRQSGGGHDVVDARRPGARMGAG